MLATRPSPCLALALIGEVKLHSTPNDICVGSSQERNGSCERKGDDLLGEATVGTKPKEQDHGRAEYLTFTFFPLNVKQKPPCVRPAVVQRIARRGERCTVASKGFAHANACNQSHARIV